MFNLQYKNTHCIKSTQIQAQYKCVLSSLSTVPNGWGQVYSPQWVGPGVQSPMGGARCTVPNGWGQVYSPQWVGPGVQSSMGGARCTVPNGWGQVYSPQWVGPGVQSCFTVLEWCGLQYNGHSPVQWIDK